jgi:uncharacterized membrane protein
VTDTAVRSIVKTVSWRLTGTASTFLISYLVLGSFAVASAIASTQLIINTILYFIHERVWNKITWGKE